MWNTAGYVIVTGTSNTNWQKMQHLKFKQNCGRSPLTRLELLRTTYPYLLAIGRIPWSTFASNSYQCKSWEKAHWHQKTQPATAPRLKNPSWHHFPASNWTQNIAKCHWKGILQSNWAWLNIVLLPFFNAQKARGHSKPRAAFVRHAMLHQNLFFDTEEDDKIEAS